MSPRPRRPRITPLQPDAEADHFAPAPKGWQCESPAGYRRRRHEWDADGRCVFCSRRRAWEPI